jgi:hypothetical protein
VFVVFGTLPVHTEPRLLRSEGERDRDIIAITPGPNLLSCNIKNARKNNTGLPNGHFHVWAITRFTTGDGLDAKATVIPRSCQHVGELLHECAGGYE